jgi:RND family efflux transporter MFP subunit
VAFKAGGYIRELPTVLAADGRRRLLQDGDHVEQGMVLARVEDDAYQQRLAQARAQLIEAQAALVLAEQQLARAQALFDARSLPKPDLDAATTQVAVVRARIDGAKALVGQADDALRDTVLRSPVTALVLRRLVEVGSLVGPGTGGFVLADITQVKVVFGAPGQLAQRLRIGATLEVTTEALPSERFTGRITRISSTADLKSRVFDVELTIANPQGRLKPGMVAALGVSDPDGAAMAADALTVPLSAVVRSKTSADGYALFVIEERGGATTVRLREVTLGQPVGNRMTVTAGLTAGDRVVVTGATLVVDGQAVRPVS